MPMSERLPLELRIDDLRVNRLIVLLVVVLAGCAHPPPAYESHYTSPPTNAAVKTAPPVTPTPLAEALPPRPLFDVASVNAKLSTDQPYTISVLGDSTGNATNEWVHIAARKIAADYNRQVTVHDWNMDTMAYAKTTVYGSGPPATIWNASGPGKSAQWSAQNFPAMVPDPVDLTIVNHGHNDPRDAVPGIGALVNLAYDKGTGGVVVLTQNPRLGDPVRAKLEADTYQQIAATFNDRRLGVMVIDVFSTFPTGDALKGMLIADGIHPNDAGEQLWADTVEAGLQLR
jgi:hypothetical protein